jgi:NAD(P)-dependent dehydrogenase (short-subunit alcohol dehydrogenase family)
MPQSPVALVTGASYGIGAAAAIALAEAGYDVVVTDLSTDSLQETAGNIAARSRRALPVPLDLRSQESIDACVQAAVAAFGAVDVLVNNAGVPMRKPALEITRQDWANVMSVNLEGTFFITQAVARQMIDQSRAGAIVSVASTHGLVGLPLSSTYGISKAGVSHMTRMLAIEWAPNGIRVNAIAPASTLTPTRKNLADPARRDEFVSRIPLGRVGTPDDMAAAVVYLASPSASFITGQTLAIDGGLTSA